MKSMTIEAGYRVVMAKYGKLVMGSIPISDFVKLSEAWGKEGLDTLVPGIATALNATFAVCRRADAERWRAEVDARASESVQGDPELAWILGTDTGSSSRTIWVALSRHGQMVTQEGDFHSALPRDADDFGRCHRLLERIPAWRTRLPEVAARFTAWGPLVEIWDEMTALYVAGDHQAVYERLNKLTDKRWHAHLLPPPGK